MGKIAVFIIKGQGFKGIERQTADRVSRHLIKEGDEKTLDLFEINRDNPLKLKDLYKNKDHDVFVFIYGNLYISHEGIHNLSRIAIKQKALSVIVPVSNESRVSLQRHGPPFLYQTLTIFEWAVRETYEQFKDKVIEAEDIDDFCLAFRKEILDSLPDDCLLADLPQILKNSGLRFAIARGVYVHRYGNNYESSRDDRYFTDRYQGMPLYGYTELFKKMLSHNNIDILFKTDYADVSGDIKYKGLVYTGPIDEYFNHCYGRLRYRSLRFDFKNFKAASFQDYAVVNYPNGYDFTRITEYKKLTGQQSDSTTVSYEYPCNGGDPYYPMPTPENSQPYEKYCEQTKKLKNVTFAGRLGAYRYMNIDVACLEGMRTAKRIIEW